MNKLQKIIQTSPGDGVATLQELMSGKKDNRNLSASIRKMIYESIESPWYTHNGNLYWIKLFRVAGYPRFSERNWIQWVQIRETHMQHSLYHLRDLFLNGGS